MKHGSGSGEAKGETALVTVADGASAALPTLNIPSQHAELLSIRFESALVLVLVARIAGFFTKLAKLGTSIGVLQRRLGGSKR